MRRNCRSNPASMTNFRHAFPTTKPTTSRLPFPRSWRICPPAGRWTGSSAAMSVSAKELADTKKGLAEGQIDIVVGTHALLGKTVKFRDLGLIVVDEEQHFGVAHKEKLKQLRAEVHVLTLTATPIPRTLQLALSGVREMSIIATPP